MTYAIGSGHIVSDDLSLKNICICNSGEKVKNAIGCTIIGISTS